ncbi:ATP synthase subunit C [Acetobacterium sp. UBA5834]|jgi:V/A-type H+-transporting ATPase subunit K|uniref:ATP synthase subunit C n=1 Tax=Acetobacterium sp. UBA5834 TaxID=1945907 RepID=UPI00257F9AF8|nr:ATP synthase subunit C [Acetobacterium sp. UBA5834]
MNVLTFITIGTALLVLVTISLGVYFNYRGCDAKQVKLKKFLQLNLSTFIPMLAAALIVMAPGVVAAATGGEPGGMTDAGLGYIAAALSTGLACVGAGYAVGVVGSAALGAVSEDPKILGKTLIFVGLAEGVAIYGLVISIMIIGSL